MPNPGVDPATSNDGYLMPDIKPSTTTTTTAVVTTMAVDNDGYLLATSPLPNGKSGEKSFEQWPMLHDKDNGNLIPVWALLWPAKFCFKVLFQWDCQQQLLWCSAEKNVFIFFLEVFFAALKCNSFFSATLMQFLPHLLQRQQLKTMFECQKIWTKLLNEASRKTIQIEQFWFLTFLARHCFET